MSEAKAEKAQKRQPTALPDGFAVTDDMAAWAKINTPTLDVHQTTQEFIDYCKGRDWRMVDWKATWRNWLRKSAKEAKGKSRFAGAEKAQPVSQPRTMAEYKANWQQPCRWQASANRILMDVLLNVAYTGKRITTERLHELVEMKRRMGQRLATLYGDREAPKDEYEKISKDGWEWLNKKAMAG